MSSLSAQDAITLPVEPSSPRLCVRGRDAREERLCVQYYAEDLEGEPIEQVRTFAFKQPRTSVLCYLEDDGWRLAYVGPTQCTAPHTVQRATIPVGLQQTCHQVALLLHPARNVLRVGQLHPVNEPGYGWLRPMTYFNHRWNSALEAVPVNEVRSLYEPVIEIMRGTNEPVLACEARYRASGERFWERFVLQHEYGDSPDERFWPRYRVTYVGHATHWPIAEERAMMVRRCNPLRWYARAQFKESVMFLNLRVWLDEDTGHEPVTYFNFRG